MSLALEASLVRARSAFGRTGDVVATAGDYSASQVTDDSSSGPGVYLDSAINELASVPVVTKAHGRTGDVVAASGDYEASEITNDSTLGVGATVADVATDLLAKITAGEVFTEVTAALSANQANWAPTGWDTADAVCITPDALRTINGFAAPTASGRAVKHLVNVSADESFAILHNGGAATHRKVEPGAVVRIEYSPTLATWVIAGGVEHEALPSDDLEAIMGPTEYILWADDLGDDASSVSEWGPFEALNNPTVDADGYGGALKVLSFNGSYLQHPTTNLLTPGDEYILALSLQVTTTATSRYFWQHTTSSTERHSLMSAANDLFVRVGNSFAGAAGGHDLPGDVPLILIATKSTATDELRTKVYTSDGDGLGLRSAANTDLGMGDSAVHTIALHDTGLYAVLRLRFAALSVNQGSLDEAGMDALAALLQDPGGYNCPLS